MNSSLRCGASFLCLLAVSGVVCSVDTEFTIDTPIVNNNKSGKVADNRRYTQVRDDLLERLAVVMELSVEQVVSLSALSVHYSTDAELQGDVSRLIGKIACLQREVCSVVRKIAEGLSGLSCKRLKNLEKKFSSIHQVLKNAMGMFDEKKLEKTGKNGEAYRIELKKNIKKLSSELS